MKEKKFYLPGIIVPAVGILAHLLFGAAAIELVAAIITLIMNLRKKKTHRIAIGIALAAALLVGTIISAYSMIVYHSVDPSQTTKDLIMNILFGIAFTS